MRIFNPYKLFVGAFLPNWLLKRDELSFGAKCCYARLCQFAGENGECYPKQDTLAKELGATRQSVSKYMNELLENGLITKTRRGLNKSNVYQFVWHDWVTEEISPDVKGSLHQDVHTGLHRRESYKENQENHKNDSSTRTLESAGRTRKIKRKKRKKSSMKDKVKSRANDKAPKNGGNKKPNYENKPNLDLIEVWNKQPNLRAHKNTQSKVYGESLKKLEHLRQGTLYKIVKSEELQDGVFANGMPVEWTKTKWKKKDIAKAIRTLNEWCKEGNYPRKKDWIKKISLGDAIYNPRTSVSTLMSAFKNGVQPLFNPREKLETDQEFAIYEKFEKFFGATKDTTKKKIVELAKDLSGQREPYRQVWKQVDPENYGFGDGIDPGSSMIMVNHYLSFLNKDSKFNTSGFKPRANISPLSLKIDNYPWKEFVKDYKKIYGAHPISGPI